MFRKPRDTTVRHSVTPSKPSTGRPPTPPSSINGSNSEKQDAGAPKMASSSTPMLGRSKISTKGSHGKDRGSANGNILNFFKKADLPSKSKSTKVHDEGLFVDEDSQRQVNEYATQTLTPPQDCEVNINRKSPSSDEDFRYNEQGGAIKRRRMHAITNHNGDEDGASKPASPPGALAQIHGNDYSAQGPFFEDSGTDDEMINQMVKGAVRHGACVANNPPTNKQSDRNRNCEMDTTPGLIPPPLKQESTSMGAEDEFDGIDDFMDDEFPEEGEEYLERRWMEEQQQLEQDLEGEDDAVDADTILEPQLPDDGTSFCPICNANLTGVTDEKISIHVNDCLDGKTSPIPKPETSRTPQSKASVAKRFQRAAIAKPGQDAPFTFGSSTPSGSSAFSKIMSSHAEDAAWATAAASELAARGKPAYQRVCPFYKILPGFSICVDAFRYGAVEGCNAYFLSHFHSDHYIGLTSSWRHGPIYCSRVTGNLVRQQLRVDPQWVIDLKFDSKVEVPGTNGVEVTMIPANHCPGSSLFLFEKVIGKGKTPRIQRVLHCGDFRACPAHVQHPLLRPDIIDTITKKSIGQQKLDVCYLDTTYLTPKYAFPSQEDVIKACADMCVSLSKNKIDENDDWEQTKKERAGSGMVKFVRKDSGAIKEEVSDNDGDVPTGYKGRGRLLVIVGTYSIGKERICLGVARALGSKIYAPPSKQKICAALEDPELAARLTNNPLEAQVHMQMLMEIRAETLADYLTSYKPHFSRIVGFRPSGWNYRPPNSRFTESPAVQTVLHSDNWKSRYSMAELVPQRGSTREASCFGVPYSEHSSFRELTMFCCALRIDKIIPTVNVGSAKSREKMKAWCEKWAMEKKKNGLFRVEDGQRAW